MLGLTNWVRAPRIVNRSIRTVSRVNTYEIHSSNGRRMDYSIEDEDILELYIWDIKLKARQVIRCALEYRGIDVDKFPTEVLGIGLIF